MSDPRHSSRRSHRHHRRHSRRAARRRRKVLTTLALAFLAVVIGIYVFSPEPPLAGLPMIDPKNDGKADAVLSLIQLPQDDSPHRQPVEWWRYDGVLEAENGQRFSLQYVVALTAKAGVRGSAYAQILDHHTGERFSKLLHSAEDPSEPVDEGFRFVFGSWQLHGYGGADYLRARGRNFDLDLYVTVGAGPVVHGERGWTSFDGAGDAYYYSRPRMPVSGWIRVGGKRRNVTGKVWFDHQWGRLHLDQVGWRRLLLRLDNGRDLLLFQYLDGEGRVRKGFGALVGEDSMERLDGSEFVVRREPQDDTGTGAGWRIQVADRGLDLALRPEAPPDDAPWAAQVLTGEGIYYGFADVRRVPHRSPAAD